jgi:hypothetical protein
MSPVSSADPIPSFSRKVIALFAEQLREVRFPDLDVSVLEAQAGALLDTRHALDAVLAEAELLQQKLAEQASALEAQSGRALSYARIYAEGDRVLETSVAEIESLRSPTSPSSPPRKRGRPPKTATRESDLFADAGSPNGQDEADAALAH